MKSNEMINRLSSGQLDDTLLKLYDKDVLQARKERFIEAINEFCNIYGSDRDIQLFSVPGRSEISGNHTDHNRGKVIAAAVDLDIIAVAAKNDENIVRIKSKGFPQDVVSAVNNAVNEKEYYTAKSLIAGVCDGFTKHGYNVGGYDAYTTSSVLKGSGLSSSAAFEVMVGEILNHMYNEDRMDNAENARIAQYAENVFFGKPSGLMDQTACAVGGFIAIDFQNPEKADINKIDFDMTKAGYSLCIVNTGGNHADLNDDYASVPAEMKAVAKHFGREVLRELSRDDIVKEIPALRRECGDRAVLRALHFFEENNRVTAQANALINKDLDGFFAGVLASGRSSFMYLQNVYTTKNVSEQGLSLALALTEKTLSGCRSAWRVHGGGFAGTIQAFVPDDKIDLYKATMDRVFGEGACAVLKIRNVGATCIAE